MGAGKSLLRFAGGDVDVSLPVFLASLQHQEQVGFQQFTQCDAFSAGLGAEQRGERLFGEHPVDQAALEQRDLPAGGQLRFQQRHQRGILQPHRSIGQHAECRTGWGRRTARGGCGLRWRENGQ